MKIGLALFFSLAVGTVSAAELPSGSRLMHCGERALHVHEQGKAQNDTGIILLSGPTDSWAADSAWFVTLQPLLAKSTVTRSIDRLNHGLSAVGGDGSYTRSADDLACLIKQFPEKQHIVIAFASSNLMLLHYLDRHGSNKLKTAMLIDPDGLTPTVASFYAEQAKMFQDPAIPEFVRSGKYDQRAAAKVTADREHFLKLAGNLPYQQALLDVILAGRSDRERIVAQMADIGRYDQDVLSAAKLRWPKNLPVWVVDTDFERLTIEQAKDDAERQKFENWRSENTKWMKNLPGVCYLPTKSTEHLIIVEQATMIAALGEKLLAGQSCPHSS